MSTLCPIQLSIIDSHWRTLALALCTPEFVQAQAAQFERMAAGSGQGASLTVNGTLVDVLRWEGMAPVLSTETKLAGELQGRHEGQGWVQARGGKGTPGRP